MKSLRPIIFTIILVAACTASTVYAGTYTSLTGLPGIDKVQEGNFVQFINTLVQWTIAIAAALAVAMIVYGGLERMTKDSIQKHSDGTKRIQAAVWGLLIALSSYLMLATVNPNLVNLNLVVNPVDVTANGTVGSGITAPGNSNPPTTPGTPPGNSNPPATGGAAPGTSTNTSPTPTGKLGQLSNNIPISPNSNNQLDQALVPRIEQMNGSLAAQGINWRVTEAYPPKSSAHKASCHYNGTCIDANFTGGTPATSANINNFTDSANLSGLTAVYEVTSRDRCKTLKAQGVQNVLYVGHATGEHFSVYSKPPTTMTNC